MWKIYWRRAGWGWWVILTSFSLVKVAELLDQGSPVDKMILDFIIVFWWALLSTSSRKFKFYWMIVQLSRLIYLSSLVFPCSPTPRHAPVIKFLIDHCTHPVGSNPIAFVHNVLSTWSDILSSPKHWNSVHCSVGHLPNTCICTCLMILSLFYLAWQSFSNYLILPTTF